MANTLNQDFVDFIMALNKANVEYVLVGGYAVIYHGYNRTTGDIDIWVNPTVENYRNLKIAFALFGMSMFDMTEDNFLDTSKYDVFSFGNPPVCIEILTKVKGLSFADTYERALFIDFDSVYVKMIDIKSLLIAKKASNRHKDKDDLEHLIA